MLIEHDAREKPEEIYWNRNYRVKQLQEGENNSNFFHNSTFHNRHGSKIHWPKKYDGSQVETRGEIKEEIDNNFE